MRPSACSFWTIKRGRVKPILLTGFWLLGGCAGPGPAAMRHPEYRPMEIRRPAVVLQVSLDQTGFGAGEFTRRERAAIPEQFEAGLIDALNSRGIFPLDVALTAQPQYRGSSNPLDRVDRGQARARAKSLQADVLVLVGMHLGRKDLVYCRETRRPFRALSTVLAVTLEVLRVSDGTRLVLEPPATDQPLTDVEADCAGNPSVRRLSIQELTEAGISRALTVLTEQ